MQDLAQKIKEKNRFKFGKNWKEFLKSLNQQKINFSKKCLLDFLKEKYLLEDWGLKFDKEILI